LKAQLPLAWLEKGDSFAAIQSYTFYTAKHQKSKNQKTINSLFFLQKILLNKLNDAFCFFD